MELLNYPFIKLAPADVYRPWLSVVLVNPHADRRIKILGLVDTGADECAIPARYASLLGHNLEAGFAKEIRTGNGVTIAYSHTVKIVLQNEEFADTLIDFMPNLHIALLGVKSFLSNFILNINYPAKNFSLKN